MSDITKGKERIVADAALADRLPTAGDAHALRLRVAIGGTEGCVDYADLLATGAPPPEPIAPAPADVAVILYTSGTTGHPKGAMLTHLNIAHSVLHFTACMKLGGGEVSALAVPASHVTGLIAVIAVMLHVGGTVAIVPEFKAGPFVELLERERVTHTLRVPAMYTLCLMQPAFATADLSIWRVGGYGGAPMPVALLSIVGFLSLGAIPVLTAFVIFQVMRRAGDYAIARPSREILYTVLPREDKYKAKHFIDTFVCRAGDQVGAWSMAGMRALGLGVAGTAWAAVPVSAAWLGIALWLGRKQRALSTGPA